MTKKEMMMNNKLSDALRDYDWLEDGWYNVQDVGGDLCSSRLIKGADWVLWFPNSINQDVDNEEFNTFQITSEETGDMVLEDATLDDVIEYVKTNAENFGWINS